MQPELIDVLAKIMDLSPDASKQKREQKLLSFFTPAEYVEIMTVFGALSGGYVTIYALFCVCVYVIYMHIRIWVSMLVQYTSIHAKYMSLMYYYLIYMHYIH